MGSNYTFSNFDEPGAAPGLTFAYGINGAGQVVGGYGTTYGGSLQGFSRGPDGNSYTTLNEPAATAGTVAYGINNAGQVVGFYNGSASSFSQGFLRDANGSYTTLRDPAASASGGTTAYGINNAGQVVGFYTDSSGSLSQGFLRDTNGNYATLSVPASTGGTYAYGINDAGQVTGFYDSTNNGGFAQGFLRGPNGSYTTVSVPGAAAGADTYASGINNAGQVVGNYRDSGGAYHGFLRDANGGYTTLDDPAATAGTYAYGINDAGQVVGTYSDAVGTHGFTAQPLCFCRGTLIATPRGDVPVEGIRVGDEVLTAGGRARPVRWIGGGAALVDEDNRPVIVRRGAFPDGTPHRDLRVTRGHSFLFGDVLVPIGCLLNGDTIAYDREARTVEVFHLELDAHDILVAEGARAESYRDIGNRDGFAALAGPGGAVPYARAKSMPSCRPVVMHGPVVERTRRRLAERAVAMARATVLAVGPAQRQRRDVA